MKSNGIVIIGNHTYRMVREESSDQSQSMPRVTDIVTGDPIEYDDEEEITLPSEIGSILQDQMIMLMRRMTDNQKKTLLELANVVALLTPKQQEEYLQWGYFMYDEELNKQS